jgi:hypothetical protein
MHRYLKPNTDEVASKVVDGEAILINLSNGMYYSMDTVGGYIWSLVADGHGLDAISAAVAQRYEIAEDQAKQDVDALAQQLLDEKVVIPADGGTPAGLAEADKTPATDAYTTPQLTKFDDMVDLFALDPPLPELSKLNNRGGSGS